MLTGRHEHFRRRHGESSRQTLQQTGRTLLTTCDFVLRQPGELRHLLHEFVVDQCPPRQTLDHELRNGRSAGRVLPRERNERLQGDGRRKFCRSSPRLSTGIPPSVGTRMIVLFDWRRSRSTSRYCRVSASGVSVSFESRCCSAWSRATSTRCRSASTCCSWAILLLMACTTAAGGCRSRRKNAVTVAIRNGGPPARGCVTSAESTRSSIVRAICVRWAMSLIEYCTMASRTPLRMALRTALWI